MSDARILWLPVAAVVAQPAQATVYLTVDQAQRLMFGGELLTPQLLQLSAAEIAAVEGSTGTRYFADELRVWKAADGYFLVDAVIGKHDLITYAVALTAAGKIRQVEILEYREAYGAEIRSAAWRRQFIARSHEDPLQIGADVQNISGATLSCQHVTEGLRRLLAVYALVLAAR